MLKSADTDKQTCNFPREGEKISINDTYFNENKETVNTRKSEVYNLSSKKKLMKPEIRLLSKGLIFIPTRTTVDIGKLITDLKLWERRMRLREFFYKQNDSDSPDIKSEYINKTTKNHPGHQTQTGIDG